MEKIYTKPQVEAKNAPCGSYAAGCPENVHSNGYSTASECRACELAQ